MLRIVPFRLFAAETIVSTGSAESGVVDIRSIERAAGIAIQAVSDTGDADVKLEVRYSEDGTTFGEYTDHDAIVASTLNAFGATPEGVHVLDVELLSTSYAQFRATGAGSNPADTVLTVTLQGVEL